MKVTIKLGPLVPALRSRGNIVLKPRLRRDFRLQSLVKGITKRSVHGAVEFGPLIGRELL